MPRSLHNINLTYKRTLGVEDFKVLSLSNQTMKLSGLKIRDKVEIQKSNDEILIKKKEINIEDRIEKFYQNGGKYTELEIDFGRTIGREIEI